MSLLPVSAIPVVDTGYNINNSLRFRNSAGGLLNRTPSVTGNNQRFTWSGWVKRGTIGVENKLFGAATSTSNVWYLMFGDNVVDALTFAYFTGSHPVRLTTTQLFRDPSAWYHIIVSVDTTQATSSNRVLIYVNGTQVTSFGTATYPTLNQTTLFNTSGTPNYLGMTTSGTGGSFDGYMAEVNFIDGQALTPSSFGETDVTTGVWKPKAYSGTYGTNGFYLKFADASAATAAAIGKDSSGNGNNWTPTGVSVTAGVTYDAMTDSPTNTSETVANYPVGMRLIPFRAFTNYQNGNLTINNGNVNSNFSTVSNMSTSTDKYYWETTITAVGAGVLTGVMREGNIYNTTDIDLGTGVGTYGYNSNGNKVLDGVSSAYGASYTTGDVIAFTYDGSTGVLTAYKNNVSQGTMATLSTAFNYLAAWKCQNTAGAVTFNVNFGQRPFAYTIPTGFKRLNTFNLPNRTIVKGNNYMDANIWTGNATNRTITNAASFRPDLVWIKKRVGGTNRDHRLLDIVRGATIHLASNQTNSETTETDGLTSFNSTGFSLGVNDGVNGNNNTYVGWQWQAGSSTVTNTSGSISAQVCANTTAGFSIVTYTGTGANATVGHGLGVAPSMVIVKRRNVAQNWQVRHTSIAVANSIQLNLTNASAAATTVWNSTAPTSTVFSIGTSTDVNANTGTYVAYCWAAIAGFSAFGSYTGNANANGPFVYLGFRPKFLLIKNTTQAADWRIYDTSRSTINVSDEILFPNTSVDQGSGAALDILSNGFKLRNSTGNNASANVYIYAAFAENPFKNSLAR